MYLKHQGVLQLLQRVRFYEHLVRFGVCDKRVPAKQRHSDEDTK